MISSLSDLDIIKELDGFILQGNWNQFIVSSTDRSKCIGIIPSARWGKRKNKNNRHASFLHSSPGKAE
jgi:hypothetical protein